MSADAQADAYIRAHYKVDMTAVQIAAKLGWKNHGDAKVRVRAQRMGIAAPGMKLTERPKRMAEIKRTVREKWNQSRTAKALAKELGCRVRTVVAAAVEQDLPSKSGMNTNMASVREIGERNPLPAPDRPATSVFVVPASAARKERQQAVDALAPRARWTLEAMSRSVGEVHCICGAPGAIHCSKHKALLEREGVL